MPRESVLGPGLALEGFYEYYLTPRNSVRMGVGWARPTFDGESSGSLRYVRVALDTVYNREAGRCTCSAGRDLLSTSGSSGTTDSSSNRGQTRSAGSRLCSSSDGGGIEIVFPC